MSDDLLETPVPYVENIRAAVVTTTAPMTIYDPITVGDPSLWIPTPELERLLDKGLTGVFVGTQAQKSRSKVAKTLVCQGLGYPVPLVFKKTKPSFLGQIFETHVQLRNNLQVWNEELSLTRRYVLIRPTEEGVVQRVRVVTGDILAKLDRTGRLTQKYQARCTPGPEGAELIASQDTPRLRPFTATNVSLAHIATPVSYPVAGELLPIAEIFARLQGLIGSTFKDAGAGRERIRGAVVHRLVCEALGYGSYHDDGQFPDIRHQLLEVKLQIAQTIDLGVALPSNIDALDVPQLVGEQIRNCDVRYAIFCARTDGNQVTLTHLFVTTGEAFFSRFPQCQGRVLNQKLQIGLPRNFFERDSERPQYELFELPR